MTISIEPAGRSIPEPVWEIATLFPYQGQWSEGEYLELNTNHLVEFSDGNLEVLVMPTELHQDIVIFLLTIFQRYIEKSAAGKVMIAPMRVKLFHGKYREPDVLFMKAENADRRGNEFWLGADLVMEVVSSDDRQRDLEVKRLEYARSGIPEYWIVDPMLKEITVLTLDGDHYVTAGVHRPGENASSVLLNGFVLHVAAVFDAR